MEGENEMKIFDELLKTDAGMLSKYNRIVKKAEGFESVMSAMSDEELRSQTAKFKKRIQEGQKQEEMLPEIFASIKEAAKRVLHQNPYPVQLLGGVVLTKGDIAEMKTGEGKTLTAIFPVYYLALQQKGVHVITVNEYLAKRDAAWMGDVYRFMGLSVGCNGKELSRFEKRQAFLCDVTYTTNSELGFDYLRDNLCMRKEDRVLRGLHAALLDEADSILIDEARTPLIISGKGEDLQFLYMQADRFVKSLNMEDYEKDVQTTQIYLTSKGISKAEKYYHVDSLYDQDKSAIVHSINNALRANYVMSADVEYMVQDDEIILIDQFTGRKMQGREFSDGLHQAIQAKEHVSIKQETKTIATITYQNFFRMYDFLCGMTGTAKSEEDELLNIYNMRVLQVPTNKPCIRQDEPDQIFATKREKYEAIIEEVKRLYEKGQPVLVGTLSVEVSELLSKMLKQCNIPHEVLNARNDAQEAHIIQEAGKRRTVTIATNMAARGTDIRLAEGVAELGGLVVLGSERHDAARIDNQLRGRSGRQGDPGCSRFYVSMQDDLIQKYHTETQNGLIQKVSEGRFDEEKTRKMVDDIQKYAEVRHFGQRKNTLEFDNVLMEQRMIIYGQRDEILNSESLGTLIESMLKSAAEAVAQEFGLSKSEEHKRYLLESFHLENYALEDFKKMNEKWFAEKMILEYQKKAEEIPFMNEIERRIVLGTIDQYWQDHVDGMERLKQGIYLRSYAQKKPQEEYKDEGYQRFDEMMNNIVRNVAIRLLSIKVQISESENNEEQSK